MTNEFPLTPAKLLCEPWRHPLIGCLQSRVVMTAMTRSCAGPGHVATPAMAAYYARRAAHGVGLILTEATAVHSSGDGFPDAPRMETGGQVASWKPVIDAVHDAGSKIMSQLLHCGRISHPDYTDGAQLVSATNRAAGGLIRRSGRPYPTPRRLSTSDIALTCELFGRAASRALAAGFDGVELHLAHGYLADQFFDARINDRTDQYGGSVDNRCRFGVEVVETVLRECGAARVVVRISPSRWMDGTYDWPDLEDMLQHLIPRFDQIGLRMLDVSCARADYHQTAGWVIRQVRPLWPHFLIGGASLDAGDAQAELDGGLLDMVTYGRLLIANPDLVERFRDGRSFAPYDVSMLDVLT